MVIQIDSRERKNESILKYFDNIEQKYIISKMYAGDYQNVNSTKVLIDKKDSLVELASNLCRTTEHARIKREIARAKDIECERFIFLIADNKITNMNEVHNWEVPRKRDGTKYTMVPPSTLEKIMKTMNDRYGVEFIFCPRKNMGQKIIELLN